jgi:TPR repeat protein
VIEDDEPILEAALRAFHVAGTLGDAEAIRRFARTSRHSTADNQRRGLALLETLEQPADLVLRGWVLSWLGELEASAAVQRRAAEAGDLDAAFELSILHGEGLGVDADAAEARRWLTKAADGGHPQALYNLAAAAATGADGERDLEEAAALYRRAAQGGYGRAAATLAVMMLAGEVEGSAKEACDWLDRADERGFASWRLLEAVGIDDPRAAP